MSTPLGGEPRPDRRNGIEASSYAWLRRAPERECDELLQAMADVEIACYLTAPDEADDRRRDVYVDAFRVNQAREVAEQAHRRFAARRVTLDAQEVDARFAELISGLDTVADRPDESVDPQEERRAPEAGPLPGEPIEGWRRGDGDWLAELPQDEDDEEEGYEPPPPAPMPRPTSKVVGGVLLMITGCIMLFAPTMLPIPGTVSVAIGVALLGAGVAYLLMQLREPPGDPFDDGARV